MQMECVVYVRHVSLCQHSYIHVTLVSQYVERRLLKVLMKETSGTERLSVKKSENCMLKSKKVENVLFTHWSGTNLEIFFVSECDVLPFHLLLQREKEKLLLEGER